MTIIDELVALLSRLPGLGKKSALRMAWYLLEADESYVHNLASRIERLKTSVVRCDECGAWADSDPCPVCADPLRDRSIICVVERPQDVRVIDDSREYRGLFHVLGGVIAPLEGIGPDKLRIAQLGERLARLPVKELILALNPTVEGDTTALYLQRVFKDAGVEISRLASGLPVGGDLEYADRLTLSRSFRGRIRMGS